MSIDWWIGTQLELFYKRLAGSVGEDNYNRGPVNDALNDSPELVNSAPYGDGWMFKIKISDESELAGLLDAAGYQSVVDSE